jgi:alpha-glucosidase
MNPIIKFILPLVLLTCTVVNGQNITVKSPDGKLSLSVANEEKLTYLVSWRDRIIVNPSAMGFEFRDEEAMTGNFTIVDQSVHNVNEKWIPVVKAKHSEVLNNYNELRLVLKEKSGPMRQMELYVRAYNDGAAFRYKLFRGARVGDRQIVKELTSFSIPGDPKAWIVEYGGYSSSNESEFMEHPLSYLSEKSIAGMPMLMEYGNNCWVAITEAKIENYAAFYIGTNGTVNQLTTKLVPVPGEP